MTDLDRLLGQTIDKPLLEELKHIESQVAEYKMCAEAEARLVDAGQKQIAQIQRDYSHLLQQKKDGETSLHNLRGEIAKLKEELVYLNELNNGLDYCAEQESIKSKQLKSTLDEIKTITSSVLFNKELEQIKSILTKHEDNI
jgi:chromosome segregation ATPase